MRQKMTRPARGFSRNADARTRKMRAILAACKRLGLDQDTRQELQTQLIGVASMTEMTEMQLGQLLDHLNRDYQGKNPQRPHIAKIKALWWSLYWLGSIDDAGDRALSAFVQRQTGIAALRFLDHANAHSVIEALKSWLEREGVEWMADGEITDLSAAYPARSRAEWDRWSIINQLSQRLFSADSVRNSRKFAAVTLKFDNPDSEWSSRQLDDVIRLLGKKWRDERP